ncbi:MAG TPA: diguanylate cyclase [Thermoanaerobaculia bacterium]
MAPPAEDPPRLRARRARSAPRPTAKRRSIDARVLEVLNEIARIATADLELRPMLQRITDALMSRFDWQFVAIVSVDAEHGAFVCEAVSSRLPSAVQVGYSRPIGSGVVGEVAATGKPILIDDVRTSENYVETMEGARSELCVPVTHQGNLVAILNLESIRVAAFHDELPLLETVAEQIAGAIANARLYEELTRRAMLLEVMSEVTRIALEAAGLQSILDRIVRYAAEKFSLNVVAISLVTEGGREFELMASAGTVSLAFAQGKRWPIHTGIVGRAMLADAPQLVLDVRADPDYLMGSEEVAAEYAIPIRFRERILGVLNLESMRADVFSRENQMVFRSFADQVAGAIYLARVNQQLIQTSHDLESANLRLQELSASDALTGIANRRGFDSAIDAEWRRAYRSGSEIALMMIDIDHFKAYNDWYGHQTGDACLKKVAQTLAAGLHRAGDFVARYGGEEFVAILSGTDVRNSAELAERLRRSVQDLAIAHEASITADVVTISIGVASALPRESSLASLVATADRALYVAKREGRNCVR